MIPDAVWRKFHLGFLLFAATAAVIAAIFYGPSLLSRWVAGPAFNHMISRTISHALKVDGQLGRIESQPDLSVTVEGFSAQGWPGQAIGSMESGPARAWFDPTAILRGEWRLPLIRVDRAELRVINPDNKLKALDPVIPPKPWYANLLPSRFSCGWIDCANAGIELPVGTQAARCTNLRLGANSVGKDFQYFGRHGNLHFPGAPALAIDAFQVLVTRDFIDIGHLYLREPDSARSNLSVSGRLGQRADKSILAKAELMSADFRPFLPTDIARVLGGKISGSLTYKTDAAGANATGGGTIRMDEASLSNWPYLDQLASHAADSRLRRLDFEHASLDYELADGVFTVANLDVRGRQQIDLHGSGSWNIATQHAAVSLHAARIPLGAYLPTSLAGGVTGELSGDVQWSWRGTDVRAGRGGGSLHLKAGTLRDFEFQKFLSRFLKDPRYDTLALTHAGLQWKQGADGLEVDTLDVMAGGLAGLRGSVQRTADGTISGTLYAGLPVSALHWLPDATKTVFAKEEDGLHWCTIKITGTEHKPETDITGQVLRQLEKHPLALAGLAVRGLSWWLGDATHRHPHPAKP